MMPTVLCFCLQSLVHYYYNITDRAKLPQAGSAGGPRKGSSSQQHNSKVTQWLGTYNTAARFLFLSLVLHDRVVINVVVPSAGPMGWRASRRRTAGAARRCVTLLLRESLASIIAAPVSGKFSAQCKCHV
eukprot:8283-Heterococcus_DN1.PRE.1